MTTRKRHHELREMRGNETFIKHQCRNTPLQRDDRRFVTAKRLRERLAYAAFTTGLPPPVSTGYNDSSGEVRQRGRVYLGPADAYTVAFLALLDSGVVEHLKRLFADERAAIMSGRRLPIDGERRPKLVRGQRPDEPGVIYCFWNTRDRPELKKIGRSRRRAEERGREWEATLEPEPGQQIVMLFSVPTRYNVFAERVVHAALLCEHQDARVNERSGQLLTEYYRVTNLMALKLFVMLCIGYIDQWGDRVRREFETRSTIYSEWAELTQNS
jgi:hypothetical protein